MSLVISRKPRRAAERRFGEHDSCPDWLELEQVDCPLCGAGEFDPVMQTPDFETGLGGEFHVVRCTRCGLAFTNPRPTISSIGQFYASDYAPHDGHTRNEGWRERWRGRLEHAVLRSDFDYPPQPVGTWTRALALLGRAWNRSRRRRAGWLPFRGQGRLLDFGCGGAVFAGQMQEYGWSVEGLELFASVAARAERATGMRVRVGTLPHPDVRPSSFDAITMWSSLEHVHDPRGVVAAAREALRPGGNLLVYVPNLASWSFDVFREGWIGLDLPRHLIHFTPSTLRDLLQGAGFRVNRLQQIGRDGWLRKSVRRARKIGRGSRWLRACTWKPAAQAVTRWTELTGRADSLLALAQRE